MVRICCIIFEVRAFHFAEDVGLHYSHGVVVEDAGNIYRRELAGSVRDEQAGLSHFTVSDYDTPGEKIKVS